MMRSLLLMLCLSAIGMLQSQSFQPINRDGCDPLIVPTINKLFREGDYDQAIETSTAWLNNEKNKNCSNERFLLYYVRTAMSIYMGNYYNAHRNIDSMTVTMKGLKHLPNASTDSIKLCLIKGEFYAEIQQYDKARQLFHQNEQIIERALASRDPSYITEESLLIEKLVNSLNIEHCEIQRDTNLTKLELRQHTKAINSIIHELNDERFADNEYNINIYLAYAYIYLANAYHKFSNSYSADEAFRTEKLLEAMNILSQSDDFFEQHQALRVHLLNEVTRIKIGKALSDDTILKNSIRILELLHEESKIIRPKLFEVSDIISDYVERRKKTTNYTSALLSVLYTYPKEVNDQSMELARLATDFEQKLADSTLANDQEKDEWKEDFTLKTKLSFLITGLLCILTLATIFNTFFLLPERKKQKEFFENLNQLSSTTNEFFESLNQLSKTTDEYIGNSKQGEDIDFEHYFQQIVRKSFELAKSYIDFDVFLVGVRVRQGRGLRVYPMEQRANTNVTPEQVDYFDLKKDTNRLPVHIFNSPKGEMLEGNFVSNYKLYVEELLISARGNHSTSIMYVRIGEDIIVSAQSVEKNKFSERHLEALRALGKTIAYSYEIMRAFQKLTLAQRDISHRVKNHLSALKARVGFQLTKPAVRNSGTASLELQSVKSRITAMLGVHQTIHEQWKKEEQVLIPAASYFQALLEMLLLQELGFDRGSARIVVDLANNRKIHAEIIHDLSTVLGELVLNVHEHAYATLTPSNPITVSLTETTFGESNGLQLTIIDHGRGLDPAIKRRDGALGLILVEKIVTQRLEGTITFTPTNKERPFGTTATVTIPI